MVQMCNTCKYYYDKKTTINNNIIVCGKIKEKITPYDYCNFWKKATHQWCKKFIN